MVLFWGRPPDELEPGTGNLRPALRGEGEKEATARGAGDVKLACTLGPSLRNEEGDSGGGTARVPGAETGRESQRESEHRQKSGGWWTTCTGRIGKTQVEGGKSQSRTHLPAPGPAPSRAGCRRAGGRVAPKPASARKSHFPDAAGALAELCEECPR